MTMTDQQWAAREQLHRLEMASREISAQVEHLRDAAAELEAVLETGEQTDWREDALDLKDAIWGQIWRVEGDNASLMEYIMNGRGECSGTL
jgi:hypothetical protein